MRLLSNISKGLGVGLSHLVDITSRSLDDLISYATSRAWKKTNRANTSKKIEQVRNQLEMHFQSEKHCK
jgi:hypothetical protein